MKYEVYETVGDMTVHKSYDGTPEEIGQLIKLENKLESEEPLMVDKDGSVNFIPDWQGHKLRDMKVTVDGSKVAKEVKKALDEQYKRLQDLYE